jgi:hypothetical protein
MRSFGLESQLAEEPLVFGLTRVVSLLEDLANLLASTRAVALVLEVSSLNRDGLLEVDVKSVSVDCVH